MRIGILALQGAVVPHQRLLEKAGAEALPVRTAGELPACDGLIVPGGESSTMLNLIRHYELWEPLARYARERSVWGVCAGSILMASAVTHPAQQCFALIDATVCRNAYGRQNESFIATVSLTLPGQAAYGQECVFIRAPRVETWNPSATVIGNFEGAPVALQQGRHLLTTFHPELSGETRLHEYFVSLCQSSAVGVSAKARA